MCPFDAKSDEKSKKDFHYYACALRIKLRLIQLRSVRYSKLNLKDQAADYKICLNHMNSLGVDWLSEEDERETIELLFTDTGIVLSLNYPQFKIRGGALGLKKGNRNYLMSFNKVNDFSEKQWNIASKDSPPLTSDSKVEITQENARNMLAAQSLSPIALEMRPFELISDFLLYYRIIITKTPAAQYDQVKELLRRSRNSPKTLVKYLHSILTTVMYNGYPHQFPTEEDLRAAIAKIEAGGSQEEFIQFINKHIL